MRQCTALKGSQLILNIGFFYMQFSIVFDRPYDAKNPYLAPVSVHRELHEGGDRSCMHIEFDISGSKVRYDAGDHVAVFAVNDAEIVEKLGARLNVDLGTVFTLTNLDGTFTVCFELL